MTSYSVQYSLPVDNPVMNVSMERGKGWYKFVVPINHPQASTFTFAGLLEAVKLSGLFTLSPRLNNKRLTTEGTSSKPVANGKR